MSILGRGIRGGGLGVLVERPVMMTLLAGCAICLGSLTAGREDKTGCFIKSGGPFT